jgi:hypothetical protein
MFGAGRAIREASIKIRSRRHLSLWWPLHLREPSWAFVPRLARAEGRDPRFLTIVLRGALMRALVEDVGRRGIRTKAVVRTAGRVRGGIRFGVGALAHLLKNRFYRNRFDPPTSRAHGL